MQHPVGEIIQQLLVDLSLGVLGTYASGSYTGGAWPVFSPGEPAVPDNCITVRTTEGRTDARSMITGEVYRQHGFQIRIRAKDEPTGWQKAEAVREAIELMYQKVVHLDAKNYLVHCCSGIGSVLQLGKETPNSARSLFTVNATASIVVLN